MIGTDGQRMPPRARSARDPLRRPRIAACAAFLLAALVLAASGCVVYDADVRIAPDGKVLVRERLHIDPEWREAVQDSLQAVDQVLLRYADEARNRGGKLLVAGGDSAVVEFRYPSLAAFARAWPDSADEGQEFDRSVHRHRREGGGWVDELILWRMSPPDRSREVKGQRYPVLGFRITPPVAPLRHNAHTVRGGTYGWRFTEDMAAPDSVWIVWPAAGK